MSVPHSFPMPGADDEDAISGLDGKLTAEQAAALAVGLADMQPVPLPSELKSLANEAIAHPAVTLDPDAIAALLSGSTHPHEVLDQLIHPNVIVEQLNSRRTGTRRNDKPSLGVSHVGRLQRLSTDTCYATAARSPLHRVPGLKVLVVNPRFLAKLQHTFTKGQVTDPVLQGTTPGLLEIDLPSPADLRRMIVETVQHHLQDYDWSDSIARTGIQEALVAMTMRVRYADGRSETIVVVIDGQSRLVSAWRNVLGITPGTKLTNKKAREYAELIAGRMFAHDAVAQARTTINTALQTVQNHGWSVREIVQLHSYLAPVNLVLGTFDRSGRPCDTTQWFSEFLTQIHLRTRPWGGGSDREKAVADALTVAARAGKLTQAKVAALSGHLHGEDFTRATSLPFHPAYARAALIEAVLSATAGPVIRSAIAEALSLDPHDSKFPRKLLEVVAIFATRFLRAQEGQAFPSVVHTWTDGGAITREMWARVAAGQDAVTLTRLTPAHLDLSPQDAAAAAVTELRKRAEGDETARAELALLGGDALIVAEALTRDRGSKEKLTSDKPQEQYTPYRARPHTIIAALSATAAGRLMLGAALADWVRRVTGEPETFALSFTVPKVRQNPDGTAGIVTRYEVPDRALEWDVFDTALFGLPSSRRAEIKSRQTAARTKNTANSDTDSSPLETLQTQIHAIGLTLEKILSSDFPPRFATEAHRDELQQWVLKLGADVGKISFEPPSPAGDVYAYPEDGRK